LINVEGVTNKGMITEPILAFSAIRFAPMSARGTPRQWRMRVLRKIFENAEKFDHATGALHIHF